MIITIKGADFSSANIGTLSTYIISKSIGSGASFDIPNFVDKNSSVNWTITLDEGYTFGTYSVTMGGEVITPTVVDNVMTIAIAEVTGNVRIVVATINENTGEEDVPVTPDEPVTNPILYSFTGGNFIQGSIYQGGVRTGQSDNSKNTTEPYVLGLNKTRCCIRPDLSLTVDSGARIRLNISSTTGAALNVAIQSFGADGAELFSQTKSLTNAINDTTWQTNGYEFNIPSGDTYMWVLVKKDDNSNITPSDIASVTITKILS